MFGSRKNKVASQRQKQTLGWLRLLLLILEVSLPFVTSLRDRSLELFFGTHFMCKVKPSKQAKDELFSQAHIIVRTHW